MMIMPVLAPTGGGRLSDREEGAVADSGDTRQTLRCASGASVAHAAAAAALHGFPHWTPPHHLVVFTDAPH